MVEYFSSIQKILYLNRERKERSEEGVAEKEERIKREGKIRKRRESDNRTNVVLGRVHKVFIIEFNRGFEV